MRKSLVITAIVFLFSIKLISQTFNDSNGYNVSDKAFSEKVSTDYNFLILGENSPQQGISATLNDDQTNIKISGNILLKGKHIISIEADLSASNGLFFFDEKNGSDKGRITGNYFLRIGESAEFYRLPPLTKTKIKLEVLELITQAKSDYGHLKNLIRKVVTERTFKDTDKLIKEDNKDSVYIKLNELISNYLKGSKITIESLGERNFKETDYYFKNDDKEKSKRVIYNDLKKGNVTIVNAETMKLSKLLNDFFTKREFILKKLEDSIQNIELKNAEKKWASTRFWFLGISPFFERQGLKRFSFDETLSFDDMFVDERGSSYGFTATINFSQNKEIGSLNEWKPQSIFARAGISFSRSSNFSSFKNSSLGGTELIGTDVNGNPVQLSKSNEAFVEDTPLEFGFRFGAFAELYIYPFKSIGVFGRFGYDNINFDSDSGVNDIKRMPLRTGLLFNLNNKEKDKPIVTIQAFLDRTDLRLDPSEPNNDLRFGIGVGLPINLRSNKKSG